MRKSPFRVKFQSPGKKTKPQTVLARRWAELNQSFVTVWDSDMFV